MEKTKPRFKNSVAWTTLRRLFLGKVFGLAPQKDVSPFVRLAYLLGGEKACMDRVKGLWRAICYQSMGTA